MNKLFYPRLKQIQLTFVILTIAIFQFQLSAKEWDTTHEKPQIIDPDNHRLYFRFVSGVARGQIPEKRMEMIDSYVFSRDRIYSLLPLTSGDLDSDQYELEYRYKDKIRIFSDSRKLYEAGDFSEIIRFREIQKRSGIGYYHPLSKYLYLGASIRDANIKQDFKSDYSNLNTSDNSLFFSYPFVESQMRTKGWVPGIHLEIKPLRWFEIHVSRLFYHMGGDISRSSLNFIPTSRFLFYAPLYVQSDFIYSGVQDKIDIVIRYSSWFATRWGYTRDNMNIKFNQYYLSSFDYPTSLLMSAIGRNTSTKLDFDSVNFTIEFSKSFGEEGF